MELYRDWLDLCEIEDEEIAVDPSSPCRRNNTSITTPTLNSVLKFNILQLHNHIESSQGLLQRFPPIEEPEPSWDHSPEFLHEDRHITWNDSLDVDHNLSHTLENRQLFSSPGEDESLTSMSSDDLSFFDESHTLQRSRTFIRSDLKRKPVHYNNRSPLARISPCNSSTASPKHSYANLADKSHSDSEHTQEETPCNPSLEKSLYRDITPDGSSLLMEEQLTTSNPTQTSRRLRNRRERIDYKYFNSHGWQSQDDTETDTEKKKKPRS